MMNLFGHFELFGSRERKYLAEINISFIFETWNAIHMKE